MDKEFKKVSAVRGMNDILPEQSSAWITLENTLRKLLDQYAYQNIRTPVLEHTRLFARGIGEVTDIVEKEMYTFTMSSDQTNKDNFLTMRPEFTAGIVRAAIEHNLAYQRPQRLYSIGPVFRHERPQKGRYRQFHQLSIEAIGFDGPDVDAEQVILLNRLWQSLGLKDVRLEINSLGQKEERLAHRDALINYLEQHKEILDEDSLRRMYKNPLRVLDTKNPELQKMANEAPKLLDFLTNDSLAHFEEFKARLDEAGIPYTINTRLVRGLDYYNLTVFEWVTDRLGAQGTVCGGGRYDGLFEVLGGKATAAVGFGLGLERLLSLIEQNNTQVESPECDLYFVHQGKHASRLAAQLAEQCRDEGYRVIVHAGSAGFKSQFKRADNSGAKIAIIIGENEFENQRLSIKYLRQTEQLETQTEINQTELISFLKGRI